MDKYFNYGFNEETWRYHAREMQERAALVTQLAARSDLQNSKKDPLKKKNKQILLKQAILKKKQTLLQQAILKKKQILLNQVFLKKKKQILLVK